MTLLGKFLLITLPFLSAAQQPTPPAREATITYGFDRPGLAVPVFLLTLHGDGTGTYSATVASPSPPASRYSPYPAPSPAPPTQITRAIVITPRLTAHLFEQVRGTDRFRGGCEAKAKNIANTGAKTLTYSGTDGEGRCTYNYTEIKAVESLSDAFQSIAFTLEEGRKLEQVHRYDRLGLDQEMRFLVDAVREGHALELGNIAEVLTTIANDPQVIERARNRAATLLAATNATP